MKSLIVLIILALLPNIGNQTETRFDNNLTMTEKVVVVDDNMAHFNLVFKGSWESNIDASVMSIPNSTEATNETVGVDTSTTPNNDFDGVADESKETVVTQPTTAPSTFPTSVDNKNDKTQTESEKSTEPTKPTEPVVEPTAPSTTKPSTNTEESKPATPTTTEQTAPPSPTEPEVTEPVPTTPKKCATHELQLSHTTIDAQYQLYNYVTDYYKCTNCTYTESESHIATNGISTSGIAQAETELYNALNNLRTSNGLSKLWRNDYWDSWAATRAQELAVKYGHSRPNGGSWTNSDGTYFTVGENVASGNSSGYDFYLAFVNSGSHYGTMTIDSAVGVGIGIYVDAQGRTYCAMVLVAPF